MLTLQHYASEEQSLQSTRDLVRILEVKGYRVLNATHNGTSVLSEE